jgi:hypothetical protein
VLYFNWKVLQLPVPLMDYVIMHELVHLVEGHHGPEFWKALDRAMPDWQRRKDVIAGKAKDYLVFGLRVEQATAEARRHVSHIRGNLRAGSGSEFTSALPAPPA